VLPFSLLLSIKKDQKFVWGDEQQKAFDEIKQYMKEPPVLVPPQLNKPFKLYRGGRYPNYWIGPYTRI
jgi:hypothetical protein